MLASTKRLCLPRWPDCGGTLTFLCLHFSKICMWTHRLHILMIKELSQQIDIIMLVQQDACIWLGSPAQLCRASLASDAPSFTDMLWSPQTCSMRHKDLSALQSFPPSKHGSLSKLAHLRQKVFLMGTSSWSNSPAEGPYNAVKSRGLHIKVPSHVKS